jgi:Transposase DDE domain group 1
MSLPRRSVVRFYNKRGTAEQWIKEGKQATHWTRLSCHRFRANEVRLQLSVLAYNLGNLWRRVSLPERIKSWSLTSLQHRLVKTGGRLSSTRATTGCCWQRDISTTGCSLTCCGGSGHCQCREDRGRALTEDTGEDRA